MVAAFANPVNFAKLVAQKPLNPAEQKFVDCMAKGKRCELGNTRPIQAIDDGKNANLIRADLIRFFAWGGNDTIAIRGASIELQGAWVSGELNLSLASIPYTLAFFACHFVGEVKFAHTKCPALYMDSSLLTKGLQAYGIRTDGDLCLRGNPLGTQEELSKFISEGDTQLANARIGGNLDCSTGCFVNPRKRTFFADGITVGGNLSLQGSVVSGRVKMNAANVGMNLDCRNATFGEEVAIGLSTIKNTLVLESIKGTGVLNLIGTKADVIADDEMSRENFKSALDGLTYRSFLDTENFKSRIKWLRNRPAKHSFSRQPFEQAAKVLATMGRNKDARAVMFAMEQNVTEEQNPFKGRKWEQKILGWAWVKWRRFLEITTGYNYSLWRMARTSAAIMIAGWIIFGVADRCGYIVPHQTVVLTKPTYQQIVRNEKAHVDKCAAPKRPRLRPTEAAECLFPGYPRFDALWFSMDIFLPTSPLHQELYWYPHPRADDAFWRYFLLFWYWFQVISGWVLTSIFALTITGIMQRSQAYWSGK